MISWIQRSFQHHFKFIFAIILGATIISFVVTIGAQGTVGKADRTVATRDFFGHNLGSPSVPTPEFLRIVNDARLSAELQLGSANLEDEQLSSYALQRVAALHFADELHLPAATPAEMEAFIRNLRIFADDKGQFDPAKYAAFRANLGRSGVTEEAVAQVLGEDIRMDRVQHLLDGPGYVLPGDIRDQFLHLDTSWTVGIATVDYASYHPSLRPTDADLAKFYAENALRYQAPAQMVAVYVDFPAASHLADVKVTDAEVRAFYDADPTRFPSKTKPAPAPAAGAPKARVIAPPESPDAAFASVRTDVEAALRQERARRAAIKGASDFAYDLYQNKVAPGSAFDAYLASRGLAAKPLAPFSQEAGPPELGTLTDIGAAAFKLDSEHYYSEAIPTPSGGAVLIWKDVQPARKPALAEVRAKVAADYYEEQRRQGFIALGQAVKGQLQKNLKGGDDFAKATAAAAAQFSVKIDPKVLPAFTLASPPSGLDDAVSATLEHLEKGTVSDMVATADKGYLVYAIDRKEPDPKAAAARVAQLRSQLAAYSARSGSSAFLTEMVQTELKRSAPAAEKVQ
jgi:peptidyl-prolyl cis-trans isomerase D